jgi:hypothetical protein
MDDEDYRALIVVFQNQLSRIGAADIADDRD